MLGSKVRPPLDGHDRFAFTIEVPQRLVSHWLDKAGEQIISQIELWALVLVTWTFKDRFTAGALLRGSIMRRLEHAPSKLAVHPPTMRALARVIGDLEVSFPSMTCV